MLSRTASPVEPVGGGFSVIGPEDCHILSVICEAPREVQSSNIVNSFRFFVFFWYLKHKTQITNHVNTHKKNHLHHICSKSVQMQTHREIEKPKASTNM